MKSNIKIEKYQDLIDIVFDNLEHEEIVNIVSDLDTIWEIAMDLYIEEEIEFNYIDIDKEEYDREYCLEVCNYGDDYFMSISKIYNYEKDIYLGFNGLTFVENTTNPKMIKDIQENKYIDDFRPVIFSFGEDGEDDCRDCTLERNVVDTRVVYSIPICFDFIIDSFDEMIDEFVGDFFST